MLRFQFFCSRRWVKDNTICRISPSAGNDYRFTTAVSKERGRFPGGSIKEATLQHLKGTNQPFPTQNLLVTCGDLWK